MTTGWNSSPASANLSTRSYFVSESWSWWLLMGLENVWTNLAWKTFGKAWQLLVWKLFCRNRRQRLSSRRQSSKSWSPSQWGFHNVYDEEEDDEEDDEDDDAEDDEDDDEVDGAEDGEEVDEEGEDADVTFSRGWEDDETGDEDADSHFSRGWEGAFSRSPQELVNATRAASMAAVSILVMFLFCFVLFCFVYLFVCLFCLFVCLFFCLCCLSCLAWVYPQTSLSTSAPEISVLPALDVAMLGLTANIGKFFKSNWESSS